MKMTISSENAINCLKQGCLCSVVLSSFSFKSSYTRSPYFHASEALLSLFASSCFSLSFPQQNESFVSYETFCHLLQISYGFLWYPTSIYHKTFKCLLIHKIIRKNCLFFEFPWKIIFSLCMSQNGTFLMKLSK